MTVLIANFEGKRYVVLKNDPALWSHRAEATRASWARFYPRVTFTLETDQPDLAGYSEFYDEVHCKLRPLDE